MFCIILPFLRFLYDLLDDLLQGLDDLYLHLAIYLNPQFGRTYISIQEALALHSSSLPADQSLKLARICSAQYKLTLLLGPEADKLLVDVSYLTAITFDSTTPTPLQAAPLLAHLPNITCLIICLTPESITEPTLSQLSLLLTAWRQKLIQLEFYIQPASSPLKRPHPATSRLLVSLLERTTENMDNLQYLIILIDGYLFSSPTQRLDLLVLDHAFMFYFKSFDSPLILAESLLKYASVNSGLQAIHLLNTFTANQEVEAYLTLPGGLLSKFTYLDVHFGTFIAPELLDEMFGCFCEIQHVALRVSKETIVGALEMCENLQNLQVLRLFVVESATDELPKFPPTLTLSRIKSLSLNFVLSNLHSFDLSVLVPIFPGLSKLRFTSLPHCSACCYRKAGRKREKCLRRLLAPFWVGPKDLEMSTTFNN